MLSTIASSSSRQCAGSATDRTPRSNPSGVTQRHSHRPASAEGAEPAARARIRRQLRHARDGRSPRNSRRHDAQARIAQGHGLGRGRELPADLQVKARARHEDELHQALGFSIESPVPGRASAERRANLRNLCVQAVQVPDR